MTKGINSLLEIASDYEAIVLDQWGVLHDGTRPYPDAVAAIAALRAQGTRLAVLSNSGKRAALNAARIASKGFGAEAFDLVMTSGEALWRDGLAGRLPGPAVFPISADPADEEAWADGLALNFVEDLARADWVLLMGLPDFGPESDFGQTWFGALKSEIIDRRLPVYCTNPDRASPRAGGKLVTSPGSVAHDWAHHGVNVQFYGKPHGPVFSAVEQALGISDPGKLLMVGDSLEHDIAGGAQAGWDTCFVRGGLHAAAFTGDPMSDLEALAKAEAAPMPTYSIQFLS